VGWCCEGTDKNDGKGSGDHSFLGGGQKGIYQQAVGGKKQKNLAGEAGKAKVGGKRGPGGGGEKNGRKPNSSDCIALTNRRGGKRFPGRIAVEEWTDMGLKMLSDGQKGKKEGKKRKVRQTKKKNLLYHARESGCGGENGTPTTREKSCETFETSSSKTRYSGKGRTNS